MKLTPSQKRERTKRKVMGPENIPCARLRELILITSLVLKCELISIISPVFVFVLCSCLFYFSMLIWIRFQHLTTSRYNSSFILCIFDAGTVASTTHRGQSSHILCRSWINSLGTLSFLFIVTWLPKICPTSQRLFYASSFRCHG